MENNQIKFKNTEIEYIPEGWNTLPLIEAVDFNPKREIKRGQSVKFVSMADIIPFRKKIPTCSTREFTGGSKFRNGDTLMARITPCLENGKTSFVDFLEESESGGGSTEFIILSGKDKVSDASFVYYLSISPEIRKAAIKAMTGTSGRQRVENNKLSNYPVKLPPINEQKQIAEILSSLDDKIELNRQINTNLEEIVGALFKKWFIDSGDKLPEGWKIVDLKEVLELNYGKALKAEERKSGNVKVYGSSGLVGFHDTKLEDGPGIIVGRKGNIGSVYWSDSDFYAIDTTYFVKSKLPLTYCYYLLKSLTFVNGDSVVPGLSRDQAYRIEVILPAPELLMKFDAIASEIRKSIASIERETEILSLIRDSILPRLMNGKIRVCK